MLLIQASKANLEPGQAYKMRILAKIVNGLKFILRLIWLSLRVYLSKHESVIRVIQLIWRLKKNIWFVPFNHLDHGPLDPG